jgi:hypothetical protein
MGESGSGKTTSLRNLDPETTYIIDCDKKGLPWKGWRNQYAVDKKNYYQTDDPSLVMNIMNKINRQDNMAHIKTLVIDTINGVMVAEEMRKAKEQGFGKWTDLAQYVWEIFDVALTMRNDLTVVIIAHSITDSDDNGLFYTHIRTNGRKLEKIVLESKLNVVLLAECVDGKYIFHTKPDRSSVKTPIDMFEEETIPNDLSLVLAALAEY